MRQHAVQVVPGSPGYVMPTSPELFRRYEVNPILTTADWPHTVNAVTNPGVAQFGGETILLARVEDRTGFSHLYVARSAEGVMDWTVEPERRLLPDVASEDSGSSSSASAGRAPRSS